MQSKETKVTSFRVSPDVKERIQELMEHRQLSTNQLFEELLTLADRQAPDPIMEEEDAVLNAALSQVRALFHERATRIEAQTKENQRIKSRHIEAVQGLEQGILLERERLELDFQERLSELEAEVTRSQGELDEMKRAKEALLSTLETDRESFKEQLKEQKTKYFNLEGEVKRLEQERGQLYRQNQSLLDMIEDFKTGKQKTDFLEEENKSLQLEVQILRREKETYELRLNEQIELAILRERNKSVDDE